jgi:S1-C subfamily serine protease
MVLETLIYKTSARRLKRPKNPLKNFMESELITDSPKWEKRLKEIIPSIVSIRSITVRSFDTETQRTSQATGFVVDSELGIILSNRHVVQPGPILADAIFNQSKEEVKLIPIYRDPVHDFGFFKFSVKDLKYMKATHIPLAPEHARVGVDIRVVGNDSGERLSILSGTIARLDRKAPNYGTGHFNDWNTFYYQAASMTSGGSSGSPVVDLEGRAVALNAGGATKAASSFFLPLDRVVRALKLVQENKVITRGTIQTIFQYTPYDELRRLGLPEQIETKLRTKFELNTGMLTVEHVLPSGPSTGKLMPGDILLKIGNCWIPDFVTLEDICDTQVDKKLVLTIQRLF